MNPHDLLDDWNATRYRRPTVQHPPLPFLQTKKLKEIFHFGPELDPESILTIVVQDKEQTRRELKQIFEDAVRQVDPYRKYLQQFDRTDVQDPSYSEPTHFLAHALLLRREIALPGILDDMAPLLRLDDDQFDLYFDQQTSEAVLFALTAGGLQENGLEKLEEIAKNNSLGSSWRMLSVEAIGQCAHHQHANLGLVRASLQRLEELFTANAQRDMVAQVMRETGSLQLDSAAPKVIGLLDDHSDLPSDTTDWAETGSLNNWAKINMPRMPDLLAQWIKQNKFADFDGNTPGAMLDNIRHQARKASKSPRYTLADLQAAVTPVRKTGRNEPCPCGSGLKYKKCHGK